MELIRANCCKSANSEAISERVKTVLMEKINIILCYSSPYIVSSSNQCSLISLSDCVRRLSGSSWVFLTNLSRLKVVSRPPCFPSAGIKTSVIFIFVLSHTSRLLILFYCLSVLRILIKLLLTRYFLVSAYSLSSPPFTNSEYKDMNIVITQDNNYFLLHQFNGSSIV